MEQKELSQELNRATLEALRLAAERHAGERFYSVALFTSPLYGYFSTTTATTEGLRQVAEEYLLNPNSPLEYQSLKSAMRELKWSPCDSPYHAEFLELFERTNQLVAAIWRPIEAALPRSNPPAHRRRGRNGETKSPEFAGPKLSSAEAEKKSDEAWKLLDQAAFETVAIARDAGLFSSHDVVFNVLFGDQSDEERFLNAERLNPPVVVARFRQELTIDDAQLERLRASRTR